MVIAYSAVVAPVSGPHSASGPSGDSALGGPSGGRVCGGGSSGVGVVEVSVLMFSSSKK
ncbi:hypothetical protein [Brevibacterium casei]|uniref:hypothetical protein n=1 Tax=Brevibacterium casei TaxID=33889 RepID=UPI0028A701C6|nr:hypothetical protein [Brevibacterium casei]